VTKRGVFNMIPKRNARVLNGRRRTSRNPKIAPGEVKSEDNADDYDSKGIVHKVFVTPGQNVNAVFYLGVLKSLVRRIRRVRPHIAKMDGVCCTVMRRLIDRRLCPTI